MKTVVIVQPFRFDNVEELGCVFTEYSYVVYIIYYGPSAIVSLGCVILARESSHVDNSSDLTLFASNV